MLLSDKVLAMPSLKETNQEIMKSSMKSGDKATLQFSRNLHAAIRKHDDASDDNDGL